MEILYLAHRIPYPPNKGDKIRSYHHVRHLAQHHEVHLIAFVDERDDEHWAAKLRECCREVVLVRLDKRAALRRGLIALATGRSLSEGYFDSGKMRRAIAGVAARQAFDVAWTYSSAMVQYLPAVTAARYVADFVDVDSEKWRQYGAQARGLLRWAYQLEAARLRAFEGYAGSRVDQVLFVSSEEASLFRSFCPPGTAVQVIPNGVDTAYYRGASPPASQRAPVVLFTGALDYRPNVEAVIFFVEKVLPLVRRAIPEMRFIAVGHRPGRKLTRRLEAYGPAASVAGSVPDVRPFFNAARVYAAPLQLGRGVQNKILEAMAMEVPVVASPLAMAGLDVEPGTHAMVCEGAAEFAAAVITLLRDAERCRRMVAAATALVQQRYTWADNLALLDRCLAPTGRIADEQSVPECAGASA